MHLRIWVHFVLGYIYGYGVFLIRRCVYAIQVPIVSRVIVLLPTDTEGVNLCTRACMWDLIL